MKIVEKFKTLIPPLESSEYKGLETAIVRDGCRDPLVVWERDGERILIDGHNRYGICDKHGIGFKTENMQFDSENDAEQWIIENQFGRRNLCAYDRAILALRLEPFYAAKAKENQGARTDICTERDKSKPIDTLAIVAKKANMGRNTLAKVKVIKDTIEPETVKQLRSECTSINKVHKEIKDTEKGNIINKRKQSYIEQDKKENNAILTNEDCNKFLERLENESVDLLLTDPPYSTDVEDIESFARGWLPLALSKVKKTGRAYIFIGAYPKELATYINICLESEWTLDNPLIWTYKNTLGVTPKKKYNLNYQVCLHLYTDKSYPLDTSVTNEMFSVMEINAPDGRLGDRLHTWQKPMALAQRLVNHANQTGRMIDPFACTGTMCIAASKFGMVASGCDISSENLAIAEGRGCELAK